MKIQSIVKATRLFPVIALAAVMASCASGPSYDEVKSTLPPIPKGHGRVFVYRTATMGMALKPDVKIDDKVVGTSQARGFFYSDQKAGAHRISITTERKHESPLIVKSGEPAFVSSQLQFGILVGQIKPLQVVKETGESEIQSCSQSQ